MPSKKKKKEAVAEPSNMTTIAISRTNQAKLNKMRRGFEDYNAIITRLVAGEIDTWTEIVAIDNELPHLHTCIFQLGEDAECFYYWDGKNLRQISFEDANKMMKQPKPNITINRKEAQQILHALDIERDISFSKEITERIQKFLENQPNDKPS